LNSLLSLIVASALAALAYSAQSSPPLASIGGIPPGIGLPPCTPSPRPGARPNSVIAVIDAAHSSQVSQALMARTPTDAAQWFVQNHLIKAAQMGVTLVIIKHPYRWRPEPHEDYRFGGTVPARRAALHAAIIAAKPLLPKLCAYQDIFRGGFLSPADQSLLIEQAEVFDEDAWEAIGCQPWQQDVIDERRLTRTQHLEPIWDVAFPAQWSYPIDVTELFMSMPIMPYHLFPAPTPEIRAWFHRPVDPYWWEDTRAAYIRTVRKFDAWCLPKGYLPVHPLDIYTELNVTADLLNIAACPADYDGNGFSNGDDVDEFLRDFEYAQRYADFDGDGFLTGADFDEYMFHFMDGC